MILSLSVTPSFRTRLNEKFKRGAENQAFLVEAITGAETVKAMAIEPILQQRWEEQLAGYVASAFRVVGLGTFATQTAALINKVVIVLVLFLGARLVIGNEMTVGELVAFNMLSSQLAAPVLRLAQLWQDFQQVRLSVDRLGKEHPRQADSAPLRARKRARPDRRSGPGARRCRLAATANGRRAPGERPVQPSGSGEHRAWQSGWRWSASFTRRSSPGLTNSSSPCRRATIRSSASAAPRCPVASGSASRSRGRSSPTRGSVIFDEATSALDYESEAAIQANMRHVCQDRTVILITHRLSTLRIADRIVAIEQGRIVEDGTHDGLLRAGGRYAKLWHLQADGPPPVLATGSFPR